MKIDILVTSGAHGFAFTHQAIALQAALQAANIQTSLHTAHEKLPAAALQGDIIVAVGSWQDFDRLIDPLVAAKKPVLPWIVSDDHVDAAIVAKLNQFPFFLTTSEYCQSIFVRDGVEKNRVRVLYECVDEAVWKPLPASEIAQIAGLLSVEEADGSTGRPSANLSAAKANQTPILFTTGGDATSKGALEIIEALGKIDPAIPWIYLVKTWPGPESLKRSAKELELAAHYNIASRIKYIVGEFSDEFLQRLMNLCNIYIATSKREGFGLPLAEAQLCGKMVITHEATSTKEIVSHNETGLIAQAHTDRSGDAYADTQDLAKQITLALTDAQLRQKLSGHARVHAIERFGKHAIAQAFLQFAEEFEP